MPPYAGSNQATLLYEGETKQLWIAEKVPVGTTSEAVQLRRERGSAYPPGFSVEVAFSATPGVFEVDVMGADNDVPANYVQVGSITTVNAGFVGRADIINTFARYIALYMKTSPNAATITVTGQVTR
jgi:hypothetical protein